jgi:hypothetical protein
MTRSTQHDDAALAATLTRQFQVISRSQVLAHGMTTSALRQRLRAGGPWQRLLPGVFLAVTGTPTTEQRSMAALLYAGTGGMITGAAALGLWGIQAPRDTTIDVLIPATRQRRSTGFPFGPGRRQFPSQASHPHHHDLIRGAQAPGETR